MKNILVFFNLLDTHAVVLFSETEFSCEANYRATSITHTNDDYYCPLIKIYE